MRNIFFALFSVTSVGVLALILFSPLPAEARTKLSTSSPIAPPTAPEAPLAPATPSQPLSPEIPSSSSAPSSPPAAAAPAQEIPDSIRSGNLTLSNASLSHSGKHIDLFLSITNDGKGEERLGGAGSKWDVGDIVMVTKDKQGKEQESPLSMTLPAGKTVKFSKDETWIRVKDINAVPKNATAFPISFYFRSSPNANLLVSLKESANGNEGALSSVLDWFKK